MRERSKKRLGEILLEDGSLSRENLEEALNHQKKEGGLIGQLLIRLGYITEENLTAALGKQLKIPYLPLANYSINTDASQTLGEAFCRRHMLMGFEQDEKRIYIAMADPLNDLILEEILKLTSLKPQIFISTPSEILNMLDVIFHVNAKKELKKAV